MITSGFRCVYGPVPSRRLGRSLGIDLVPFKTCTYDCVYCPLGRTTNKTLERKQYIAVVEHRISSIGGGLRVSAFHRSTARPQGFFPGSGRHHWRTRTGRYARPGLLSSRGCGHPGIARQASLHFRRCGERPRHSRDGSAQASRRAHRSREGDNGLYGGTDFLRRRRMDGSFEVMR